MAGSKDRELTPRDVAAMVAKQVGTDVCGKDVSSLISEGDVPSMCSDDNVAKAAKAGTPAAPKDSVNMRIVTPLALTALYVFLLQLAAATDETDPLPQMFADTSIVWPILASVGYLALVFFGKKVMASREPFRLKNYMVTYNLYQTILNVWMVYSFLHEVLYVCGLPVWGNGADVTSRGHRLAFLIWVHYTNKYVELLDTVFMILRKKNKQVSFLHVYHHVMLVWSWFVVCKLSCGGDAYFGATVNSFIHVVMYSYYLFALLGYRLSFKKYITQLQLLQFVVCALHSLFCIYNGHITLVLPLLQLWVMVNMLVLFGNFYSKSYVKNKKAKKL